jgi:hypothetical protein
MDQLKQQFAVLMKHRFWILCVVTAITGVVIWFLSKNELQRQYASQKSKIDGAYQQVETINQASSTHPNQFSHQQMDSLITALTEDVRRAWQEKYDRQEGLLVWPEASLGKEFVERFSPLRPIEMKVEFDTKKADPTPEPVRATYSMYIPQHLPNLAKIIGTDWTADFAASRGGGLAPGGGGPFNPFGGGGGGGPFNPFGGGGGMPGGGGSPSRGSGGSDRKNLVVWETQSQTMMLDNLFPWRSREVPPTTLEVLYSQEDLWVLESLLEMIAGVNQGAQQPFQATIKQIDYIKIGKGAAESAGDVNASGGGGGGFGSGGMPDMSKMQSQMSNIGNMMKNMGGGGGSNAAVQRKTVSKDPADGRYVDRTFKPITSQALRTAMKSPTPETAAMTVSKRLPVAIRLKIDQRKIPVLLAACANARLPIEVRQTRVNIGGMSSSAGGAGGAAPGPGVGFGGAGMPGGGGGGMASAAPPVAEFPNDVPVDVYAVVQMYNPVDINKLGIKEVKKETQIKDIGTAVEPAATPEGSASQASGDSAGGDGAASTTQAATGATTGSGSGDPPAGNTSAGTTSAGTTSAGTTSAGTTSAGTDGASAPSTDASGAAGTAGGGQASKAGQ